MMTKIFKKSFKWLGVIAGGIIALILMDIAVLATPGPFFPEEKQYGSITV